MPTPTLSALVEQARRRLAIQLVIEQLAWGAVAGLCGLLLLLLTGTQVLRWYWPPVLLVVTAAVGWWRTRHKVPGKYQTVQRVDAAAGAGDVLATAWHFAEGGATYTPRADYLAPVQSKAEQAAGAMSLSDVLPWRRPAAAWPLLGLAMVAGATFGVRYGMTKSLDMGAPMAEVRFDTLTGAPVMPDEKRPGGKKPGLPQPAGMSLPDDDGSQVTESDLARNEDLKNFEIVANEIGRAGKGENGRTAQKGGDATEEGEAGAEESGSEEGESNVPSGSKDQGNKSAKDASQKKQPQQNDGGLMDKMRDALANLMDKFKSDSGQGESQQMASNKKGGQKSGAGKKEPGEAGKGKQDAQKGEGDDAQGEQQGEGQQSQTAKSQASQGNDSAAQNDKSGVGSQDGRKDTELAERAEAMGKLSELLGKRSKELQGEVMVEVTSSKNQQARTAFTGKKSGHADTGGEIGRDEVPLHLQHYVQQFYEQVRKQAPAPPPSTTPQPSVKP